MARGRGAPRQTADSERERLTALLLQLQADRVALTGAIMRLRDSRPVRPRAVLKILVALLKLQRANRRAAAAIGVDGA